MTHKLLSKVLPWPKVPMFIHSKPDQNLDLAHLAKSFSYICIYNQAKPFTNYGWNLQSSPSIIMHRLCLTEFPFSSRGYC